MKLTYREQLLHPNWQRKRLEILSEADWKCQSCGDRETTLHVHHKRYIKGRMAWEYDSNELVVLCHPCHEAEHAPIQRLPLAPMASSVHRAIFLLVHHADLWDRLDDEARTLLRAADSYFFSWFDQLFQTHGALSVAALTFGSGFDRFRSLIEGFHDLPADEAWSELETIVDRLHLRATQDELEFLSVEGASLPARERQRELIERQRSLKEHLSRM